MKLKFLTFLPTMLVFAFFLTDFSTLNAQATPEVLYYKFNETGTTVTNYASAPPPGTATATIMGGVTQGNTGKCGGALVGTGVASSTDYLNTGWAPNLGTGSWTIAFWSSGISTNATLYYIFGDANTTSFRCFTNGIAGSTNWVLRGAGLTDTYINGGALSTPTHNAFVYDATLNNVKAYLNGVLVSTVAQTAPNLTGTGPLKVMGYSSNVGAPAGGLLDEFRLYSRALSDVELVALMNLNTTGTDTKTACGSYTWIDGNTYTTNNTTATHTLAGANVYGCDSLVTLNLTINNPTSGTDTRTACGSYTWIDGNTYTTSNSTAMHTITGGAANGCDSMVTLNLTINVPTSGTDMQTACNSYTWIDGNTYTTSNSTATHTIVGGAANGCDSIVTLNLTVNMSTTGTDMQTACNSYTWIDGNTYTTSNSTATHTIIGGAANGCDSMVTLNLTINMPTSGTDTQAACDSYTWIDGNTYTSNNTTAMHTITGGSANGCDSVVTLNLTVTTVDTSVTDMGMSLMANAAGATYQWVDCNNGNAPISGETNQSFTPTGNGDYAVEVTVNGCTSMSSCYNITGVSVQHLNSNSTINLYPNPTENQFTVDFGTEIQDATIRIFSVDGRVLQQHNAVNGKQFNISLKDHPTAIYFVEVISNGQSTMLKVSKS